MSNVFTWGERAMLPWAPSISPLAARRRSEDGDDEDEPGAEDDFEEDEEYDEDEEDEEYDDDESDDDDEEDEDYDALEDEEDGDEGFKPPKRGKRQGWE